MSESRYWQMVAEMAEETPSRASRTSNRDQANRIIQRLDEAEESGEYWPGETLTRWALEGAMRDYNKSHKKVHGITVFTRRGRKVRKTTSYSRPFRAADSGEVIGYQLQSWWGYGKIQLIELRRDLAEQGERIADVVEAISQLIAAMERHPECATAREAWEADGRSVAEIDLGERAA